MEAAVMCDVPKVKNKAAGVSRLRLFACFGWVVGLCLFLWTHFGVKAYEEPPPLPLVWKWAAEQPRGKAWPSHREHGELGKRCGLGTNKAQTRLLGPGGGSREVLQGGHCCCCYIEFSSPFPSAFLLLSCREASSIKRKRPEEFAMILNI